MKVLVTGAAGRVGANMVKRLWEHDIAVRAMVMPGDPLVAKLSAFAGVDIVEADLGDQAAIDVACRDVTHVVHLAAQLLRRGTPVDRFYDVNAFGTLRLLEGVVHAGVDLDRFVLASSDGTYRPGAPPAVPLREDAPQQPADYYGTAKLLGEVILRNHADQYGIPFSIVRFATVISPEETLGMFRPRFWRGLLRRQQLGRDSHLWPLFEGQPDLLRHFDDALGASDEDAAIGLAGPGRQPWMMSVVEVRDAVEGVYLALTRPEAIGHAFNIALDPPLSHDAAVAAMADILGVPARIVEMPMRWRLEVDVEKARTLLGYRAGHDFPNMLRDAAAASDGGFVPAQADSGVAATWSDR